MLPIMTKHSQYWITYLQSFWQCDKVWRALHVVSPSSLNNCQQTFVWASAKGQTSPKCVWMTTLHHLCHIDWIRFGIWKEVELLLEGRLWQLYRLFSIMSLPFLVSSFSSRRTSKFFRHPSFQSNCLRHWQKPAICEIIVLGCVIWYTLWLRLLNCLDLSYFTPFWLQEAHH